MAETSPSNAGGAGSIPHQGAGIPHALQKKQNIKQKQYCKKFNKEVKKKKKEEEEKDLMIREFRKQNESSYFLA